MDENRLKNIIDTFKNSSIEMFAFLSKDKDDNWTVTRQVYSMSADDLSVNDRISKIEHNIANKIVIPPRSKNSKNEQFEGAFVREPVPGFYRDIASFDATSLYPSILQTWNISLETFVGMFDGNITTKGLLDKEYTFPEEYAVAANGAMYEATTVAPEESVTFIK